MDRRWLERRASQFVAIGEIDLQNRSQGNNHDNASCQLEKRLATGVARKETMFERASRIRKGELDDEMPDYEELTGWMQRVPKTWLPGLVIRIVEMAVIRGVFADGGLEKTVERAKQNAIEHPQGVLRD